MYDTNVEAYGWKEILKDTDGMFFCPKCGEFVQL